MDIRKTATVLVRGLLLRCPDCGQAGIYESLLQVRHHCPNCGLLFQREQGCTFTENHAGAITVEWPAFFGGGGLQRIESNENQLGQRVIPAGQHAPVFSGAYQFKRVADRICAGGARVGNHLARYRNAERLLGIDHWFLR